MRRAGHLSCVRLQTKRYWIQYRMHCRRPVRLNITTDEDRLRSREARAAREGHDFVVLSEHRMKVAPDRIRSIALDVTVIRRRVTFGRGAGLKLDWSRSRDYLTTSIVQRSACA